MEKLVKTLTELKSRLKYFYFKPETKFSIPITIEDDVICSYEPVFNCYYELSDRDLPFRDMRDLENILKETVRKPYGYEVVNQYTENDLADDVENFGVYDDYDYYEQDEILFNSDEGYDIVTYFKLKNKKSLERFCETIYVNVSKDGITVDPIKEETLEYIKSKKEYVEVLNTLFSVVDNMDPLIVEDEKLEVTLEDLKSQIKDVRKSFQSGELSKVNMKNRTFLTKSELKIAVDYHRPKNSAIYMNLEGYSIQYNNTNYEEFSNAYFPVDYISTDKWLYSTFLNTKNNDGSPVLRSLSDNSESKRITQGVNLCGVIREVFTSIPQEKLRLSDTVYLDISLDNKITDSLIIRKGNDYYVVLNEDRKHLITINGLEANLKINEYELKKNLKSLLN